MSASRLTVNCVVLAGGVVTDTVQQLAADLTREAQETGLNWVQELADRATALANPQLDDLDDLCPHCGATKGVCGDAGHRERSLPLHRTDRAEARLKGLNDE